MSDNEIKARQRAAFWEGTRRGTFLAHAIVSPVVAAILLAMGHYWIAGMVTVGAILGWIGLNEVAR